MKWSEEDGEAPLQKGVLIVWVFLSHMLWYDSVDASESPPVPLAYAMKADFTAYRLLGE